MNDGIIVLSRVIEVNSMNGQMLSSKKYETSLKHMMEPVLPSQLPKIKMDLAGLSRYAKEKGIPLSEVSNEEKRRFVPINK